jgi:LPXTG-motif cell wall-anchored protein
MLMLVIHAGDTSEHTVYVHYAPGTVLDPDEIVETISHSSQSDDPAYNHASIANVYVNLPPPIPPVPPTPPAPPVQPVVPAGGGANAGAGLAPTGSDAAPQLTLAFLALLAGAALLIRRRRTAG